MSEKILFSGRTHNVGGNNGSARSSDGFLDLRLAQPHPATEQLFGAAWSACCMGAIELAAAQRKIMLPSATAIDPEIGLYTAGGGFFLRVRLNVSLPGLNREVVQELVEAAHQICPYSKATRGNTDVSITLT